MSENNLVKSALDKAMALCAGRENSSGDIRLKLRSWGVGAVDSEEIIKTLIKENFINDARYSTSFVGEKFRYNKWGKIKIAAHLRSKGISDETIRSALNEVEDDEYKKAIIEILSSHRRSVKAKNQYDLKGKLLRFGLSRGFESNLLYEILNEDFMRFDPGI